MFNLNKYFIASYKPEQKEIIESNIDSTLSNVLRISDGNRVFLYSMPEWILVDSDILNFHELEKTVKDNFMVNGFYYASTSIDPSSKFLDVVVVEIKENDSLDSIRDIATLRVLDESNLETIDSATFFNIKDINKKYFSNILYQSKEDALNALKERNSDYGSIIKSKQTYIKFDNGVSAA